MILLIAPPQITLQRKKDDPSHVMHDFQYYETMQNRMVQLARKFKCDGVIDTSLKSKDQVVDEVLSIIGGFKYI